MRLYRNFVLFILGTLVSLYASSHTVPAYTRNHPLSSRNLTMKDGLPSNSIRAIFKDSRGLIWIGTDAGVCSYNGRKFTIYSTSDGLAGDNVWSITEDDKGYLWFGCHGGGVSRFDGVNFLTINSGNGLINDWVRVVFYSKRFHCLMVGTEKGVTVIKNDTVVKPVKPWPVKRESIVITSFLESQNFIYVTGYGLPLVKYYPGSAVFMQAQGNDGFNVNSSCASFATSSKDTIFGYHRAGIVLKRGKEILYDTLNFAQVFGIAEDNSKNIWIAAWSYYITQPGGLFRFDGKTSVDYSAFLGINDQEVWTVYFDQSQKILWVGTLNEGLFLALPEVIQAWTSEDFGLKKLNVNNVYCDKADNVWIGLNDNLIRINKEMKNFRLDTADFSRKLFAKMQKDLERMNIPFDNERKKYLRRSSPQYDHIFTDSKGNLWVGYSFGSFIYNPQTEDIQFINTFADASLRISRKDTMYCGGWNGFAVFSDIYNRLDLIDLGKYALGKYPKGNIGKIIQHGDEIWMASWTDGIYRARGLNFTNMSCENGELYFNIKDFCFDSQGHLIAGDNKGTISIYNVIGDKLRLISSITDKNGLKGNSINWLLYDGKQNLWAGTNTGLNCIDLDKLLNKKEYKIKYFNSDEGYTVFSSKNAAFDSKGNIWAGGKEGLLKISPDQITLNLPLQNRILFKELEINGIPYHLRSDNSKVFSDLPFENFELNSNDNHLNFIFEIYNYRNPEKDLFRYKLEGYYEDWSAWTNARNVYYTNLPPGEYCFKVESYNYNTGIASIPLEIPFRIVAPLWRRWYFILVILSGILIPSFFIVKARIKRIQIVESEKSAISSKIADLELNALQAQMNPHFIFNAINAIQAYVLDNKVDEALTFLSDFARVVRTSLENVSKKTITLEEALEFLGSYLNLEQMRFPDKIRWSIQLAENVNPSILLIPPMILQPYVENAIKHGIRHKKEGGKISLKVEILDNSRLHLQLQDDGIGRLKSSVINFRFNLSDERAEHSTHITEKRLQLLNTPENPNQFFVSISDLYDEFGKSSGTRVDIYLPLKKL